MTTRPRFELTRVYEDGTRETPEIIPVGRMPWDTGMDRRGFLGVGVGVASLLFLLDGKASAQNTGGQQPPGLSANQSRTAPMKGPDKVLQAHKSGARIAISPDGTLLASGSDDNTVKLWSLPDGKLLATLTGHGDSVYSLAISPDGKILAAGLSDETVKLWSLPDGKLLATLKGFGYPVEALAISPDGKILASAAGSTTVKLWSLPDGKLLATLEGHKYYVSRLAISPDGKTLASNSDGTVNLWSLPDGKLLATLMGHKDAVWALAISPDGKMLTSGSRDGTVKLWSLPDGKLLATLKGHRSYVHALAITPDSKTLASGSYDDTIKLWSLPDGKLLATLAGPESQAISPDGKILASAGDKHIKLWSLPDGKLLAALEGHKDRVFALAISPDGKTLASGDVDGVIILWDLEKCSFRAFLFDPKVNQSDAIAYNVYDKITGQVITYTLPCGSPIPPGAVCTCNCVPGTYRPPSSGGGYPSGGGTICTCNKVCTCIPVPSDREIKEAFETTDPLLILQKLSELPIQSWNYKCDNKLVRHIGPMAQDFAAAFKVGEDDKHIHPVDAQGVAFAAIQGLFQMLKEMDVETASLKAKLQLQQEDNKELEKQIESLEKLVKEKFK